MRMFRLQPFSMVCRMRRVDSSNSVYVEPAGQCCRALAVIMGPELQWCIIPSLSREDLSGCDLDRIERANVHCKGAFRTVDYSAVDWSEIEHDQEVRQFLALECCLGVVEIAEQTLAIDRSEGFDLQEFGGYNLVTGGERNRSSRLREQNPT